MTEQLESQYHAEYAALGYKPAPMRKYAKIRYALARPTSQYYIIHTPSNDGSYKYYRDNSHTTYETEDRLLAALIAAHLLGDSTK